MTAFEDKSKCFCSDRDSRGSDTRLECLLPF